MPNAILTGGAYDGEIIRVTDPPQTDYVLLHEDPGQDSEGEAEHYRLLIDHNGQPECDGSGRLLYQLAVD